MEIYYGMVISSSFFPFILPSEGALLIPLNHGSFLEYSAYDEISCNTMGHGGSLFGPLPEPRVKHMIELSLT
jgi:hypothetical protein